MQLQHPSYNYTLDHTFVLYLSMYGNCSYSLQNFWPPLVTNLRAHLFLNNTQYFFHNTGEDGSYSILFFPIYDSFLLFCIRNQIIGQTNGFSTSQAPSNLCHGTNELHKVELNLTHQGFRSTTLTNYSIFSTSDGVNIDV